jgi:hypothetical protein
MIGWIISEALPWIMAGIFALVAIIFRQRENAANKDAKEARSYGETRKRIDDADVGSGDPDADREWLSKRPTNKR